MGEEEIVLKQRILGSVNSLYELGRSKTMKKSTKNPCRYYKETGHLSRNCSHFKANIFNDSSILKYFQSKVLSIDKQTLHKQHIHEKKNETNERRYQIIKEMKVNNEQKEVSIIIESNQNAKIITSKIHQNFNLKCTFCGRMDHLWKECS